MSAQKLLNEDEIAISENFILVKDDASTRDEILTKLANLLEEHGYVKDSFYQGLQEREKVFPTGLQTRVCGVAIPHTDVVHVNHPAIAVATLQQPVTFKAMDNPQADIEIKIIIMLAIKEPKSQVTMLRKVIGILQNVDALTKIESADNPQEIKETILAHLDNE